MSNCPDLCTRAKCEALQKEIENLKADMKILKADLRRHISETVNEDKGGGAHRFIPSKKSDPKLYLTYYPDQNLLKGQVNLNNKTAKAQTEIKLTPKLDLTYYPKDNKLKGQIKMGKQVGKGETKIDLTPKFDLTYYPKDNKLKGQIKMGKQVGKGETIIDLRSLKLEPTIKLSWFKRDSALRAIIRVGKETDEDQVIISPQELKNLKLSFDPKTSLLEGCIQYGKEKLKSTTLIAFPEIKDLKLTWEPKKHRLTQSFKVDKTKFEAYTIIDPEKIDLKPTLKWNSRNNLLTLKIKIGDNSIQTQTYLDLDLTPTLKWDSRSCVLTLKIKIGDNSIEAKVDMNCKPILDLLEEIKDSLNIQPSIQKGYCRENRDQGEYFEYNSQSPVSPKGIEAAFEAISVQIEALHEDACKAIQPKLSFSQLPSFSKCELNDDTGKYESKTYTIEKAIEKDFLGFEVPDLLLNNQEILVADLLTFGLDFLWNYLKDQALEIAKGECEKTRISLVKFPELEGCLPAIALDENTQDPIIDKSYSDAYRRDPVDGRIERIEILTPKYDEKAEDLMIRRAYNGELDASLIDGYVEVMEGEMDGKTYIKSLRLEDWLVEFSRGLKGYFQAQSYIHAKSICLQSTKEDTSVLLPDPSGVWNTKGNYLLFYWKLDVENPTEKQKTWRHTTQLADPIDELIDPSSPEDIWNQYFANIYQIIGNQWGEYRSKDKARRNSLYKGWFKDIKEGERFFESIKGLTKIEGSEINNPSFPVKTNQSVDKQNKDCKMVLRKVCVIKKQDDSDAIDILNGYKPPKK